LSSEKEPGPPSLPAGLLLLGAPAALFGAVMAGNAVNVPASDDYGAIVPFLNGWRLAAGFGPRLHLLWEQFCSTRQPLTRAAAVLASGSGGACDLRILDAIAWLGWILFAAGLVASSRTLSRHVPAALALAFFLLQPQGYSNMLTATGSPGHVWILIFSFWAFLLSMSPGRTQRTAAWACAAGAALSGVNGLLVFPIIAAGKAFGGDRRQFGEWTALGIAAWALYFIGYSTAMQPFAHNPFSVATLAGNAAVMVGGIAAFGPLAAKTWAVAAVGAAVLAAALGMCWLDWRARRVAHTTLFVLFLLGSVAMAAWARIGWGMDYMLQDRYRPYGLAIVATLFLRSAEGMPGTRLRRFGIAAALAGAAFCFLSYYQTYSQIDNGRSWAEATAMNLQLSRQLPMASVPDQAGAADGLAQAVGLGTLRPPRFLSEGDLGTIRSLAQPPGPRPDPGFLARPSGAFCGYLLSRAGGAAAPAGGVPVFGVVLQPQGPLIVPLLRPRIRLAEVPSHRSFLEDLSVFLIPQIAYEPGVHPFFVMVRRPDRTLSAAWSGTVACP